MICGQFFVCLMMNMVVSESEGTTSSKFFSLAEELFKSFAKLRVHFFCTITSMNLSWPG